MQAAVLICGEIDGGLRSNTDRPEPPHLSYAPTRPFPPIHTAKPKKKTATQIKRERRKLHSYISAYGKETGLLYYRRMYGEPDPEYARQLGLDLSASTSSAAASSTSGSGGAAAVTSTSSSGGSASASAADSKANGGSSGSSGGRLSSIETLMFQRLQAYVAVHGRKTGLHYYRRMYGEPTAALVRACGLDLSASTSSASSASSAKAASATSSSSGGGGSSSSSTTTTTTTSGGGGGNASAASSSSSSSSKLDRLQRCIEVYGREEGLAVYRAGHGEPTTEMARTCGLDLSASASTKAGGSASSGSSTKAASATSSSSGNCSSATSSSASSGKGASSSGGSGGGAPEAWKLACLGNLIQNRGEEEGLMSYRKAYGEPHPEHARQLGLDLSGAKATGAPQAWKLAQLRLYIRTHGKEKGLAIYRGLYKEPHPDHARELGLDLLAKGSSSTTSGGGGGAAGSTTASAASSSSAKANGTAASSSSAASVSASASALNPRAKPFTPSAAAASSASASASASSAAAGSSSSSSASTGGAKRKTILDFWNKKPAAGSSSSSSKAKAKGGSVEIDLT